MESKDYLKDISEIKTLMNKSSKFISLSGLSGIFAGFFALIGAGYYYFVVQKSNGETTHLSKDLINSITLIILIVGFATTITTIFFTSKRLKKTKEKAWDVTTKNLIKSFSTTFWIGITCITILYFKEEYTYLIGLLFLFYGLALINASNKTNNIVKPLGIIEALIGMACIIAPKYSFEFWVLGFGLVHIVYGLIIYLKYDKKTDA